jgi:hypothetical protein
LTADGETGRRELTGASCAEVVEQGAVAIAMAAQSKADELAAPEAQPAAITAESSQPTVVTPSGKIRADEPNNAPAAETTKRSHTRFAMALGAAADAGTLPATSPGLELDAALDVAVLRLQALGAIYLPQSRELSSERGGRFSLALAGALACLRWRLESWALLGCGGFELGRLSGEGEGSDVGYRRLGASLWAAGRAEVGALAPISQRFALVLRGGVALPLARRPFVLDGRDVVHRPSGLAGRAFLGVQVQL